MREAKRACLIAYLYTRQGTVEPYEYAIHNARTGADTRIYFLNEKPDAGFKTESIMYLNDTFTNV